MRQPSRREQVSEIIETNNIALGEHAANPANKRSLLIPLDARHQSPIADALVVSRRILHHVEDPYAVHARVARTTEDRLRLFVVESLQSPVSDPTQALEYQRSVILNRPAIVTPGLDEMFPLYALEHIQGIVTPSDRIYQHLTISAEAEVGIVGRRPDSIVYVDIFMDRDDSRGIGLAGGMYKRLKRGLRILGFDYIAGQNDEFNAGFFVDKLGRKRFTQLPPELQQMFTEVFEIIDEPENFTVDIINPYLRRKYRETLFA